MKRASLVVVMALAVATAWGQVEQRVYIDIPAASTSVWFGSGSMGAVKFTTTTLMSGPVTIDVAAAAKTVYVDVSTYPRNVVFCQHDLGTGASTIGGTIEVYGIDQYGRNVVEAIAIAGPNPARISTGTVAFLRVDRVVVRTTALYGSHSGGWVGFTLGTGNAIGLMKDIRSEKDVLVVLDAAGARLTGYTVNAAKDTIVFPTAPNGSNDYQVLMRR